MVLSLFCACAQVEEPLFDAKANLASQELTAVEKDVMVKMLRPNKSISLYNALDALENSDLSIRGLTRAAVQTDSVQYITKSLLYEKNIADSNFRYLPDTLAYMLNNGNGNGFTILSADVRIGKSVIMQTENGNMPRLNNLDSESAFILNNVVDYMLASFFEYKQLEDSLGDSIRKKLNAEIEEGFIGDGTRAKEPPIIMSWEYMETRSTNEVTSKRIDAMIPVQWGQDSPFNLTVSEKVGQTVLAGCVAVSTAQLMAFWKYPAIVGDSVIHWDMISKRQYYNTQEINEISYLMWAIGTNIGMRYGSDKSGAFTSDARSWLNRIGYSGGEEKEYSFNLVEQSLDNGCPVLANGARKKETTYFLGIKTGTSYSEGHSWLIDGILKRYKVFQDVYLAKMSDGTTAIKTVIRYNYYNFQHCNWGWKGRYDGWFPEGCFYANDESIKMQNDRGVYDTGTDNRTEDRRDFYVEPVDDPTPTRATDTGVDENNFQYNNKIYINLRPAS